MHLLPCAAVRVIHLPTGLAVRHARERTQEANRKAAMAVLKSKLLVVLEEQQAARLAEIRGDVVKAEWGQQVRVAVGRPRAGGALHSAA